MEHGNANTIGPVTLGELRRGFAVLRLHLAAARFALRIETRYDPNQPRVPAGNPDGGQWTRIGERVAQARGPRGTSPIRVGGRLLHATPAQQVRLAVTNRDRLDALRRLREVDPNWRPTPQLYETIEGAIAANQAIAREARAYYLEFQQKGLTPGEFAGRSVPARGSKRSYTNAERESIDQIGRETGCHTCGTRDPQTRSGRFILDHQLPISRNPEGQAQRLFPHCANCSNRQGGYLGGRKGKR